MDLTKQEQKFSFLSLMARPQGVQPFGVYDALSAIVAERAGCEALYIGGYAAAAVRGVPDIGLLSMFEMIQHVEYIAAKTSLPLMVDIDDGHGNANNVRQNVRRMLSVGRGRRVKAIHIEDQPFPKRCGHHSGKTVIPMREFIGKLKAAIDVRDDMEADCIIIARTDAFSAAGGKKDERIGGDVEESIRRLVAYLHAGADSVWCEFPSASLESAEAISEGVRSIFPDAMLSFNVSPSFSAENWDLSLLTNRHMIELGYKNRFSTYPSLVAAMKAVYDTALAFCGDPIEAIRTLKRSVVGCPTEIINELVRLSDYQHEELKYDPAAVERFRASEGFGELKQ
ncbi:MAG: isocitrate lyase/PEP mutase family protein [Candidatus Niyogibacteria bacterium]|nr:isocitrate lyase/PEP mutase family protein [Candidatus Niyogibacteria bacterium]